jgi:hypothetical protein
MAEEKKYDVTWQKDRKRAAEMKWQDPAVPFTGNWIFGRMPAAALKEPWVTFPVEVRFGDLVAHGEEISSQTLTFFLVEDLMQIHWWITPRHDREVVLSRGTAIDKSVARERAAEAAKKTLWADMGWILMGESLWKEKKS